MKKKFNELKIGEKFRFATDPENRVRTANQIGKTEIYCPHEGSNPYDEQEVYLKSDREVILIPSKIKVRYKISDQKTVLIIGTGLYDCWWRLIHFVPKIDEAISYDDFCVLSHVAADDNDPVGIWQDDDKPVVSDLSAGTCEGMAAMMLIDSLTKLEIQPQQTTFNNETLP